jgi:hypothetical protein
MCQGSKNFWSAFQEEEILWEFHSDPLKTSGSFVIPREIYHEVFKENLLGVPWVQRGFLGMDT